MSPVVRMLHLFLYLQCLPVEVPEHPLFPDANGLPSLLMLLAVLPSLAGQGCWRKLALGDAWRCYEA